jgi:hypothetical protein
MDPGLARITAVELRRRLNAQACEVVAALSLAGVPAVVLKGLALEALLYDPRESRPRSDTDLLVPAGRLTAAEDVLAGLGFASARTGPHVAPDPLHARVWRRAADGALVDLHWRICGSHAPAQEVWDVLSGHHELLRVGGGVLTVLDPPASAMLCATHAAQHPASRRGPREDLARALERLDIDAWRSASEIARAIGANEAFGDGLRTLPEAAALADAFALPRAITRHRRHRITGAPWEVSALEWIRLERGLAGRARLLSRILFPTPLTMRRFHPLARRGRGGLALAYLLRPLHVARRLPGAVLGYLADERRSR